MSSAEGARRVLSGESNCFECAFYQIEGKCRRLQGELIDLPEDLYCSRFQPPFEFKIDSFPINVSTRKLKVSWTKEIEEAMLNTLNPCGEVFLTSQDEILLEKGFRYGQKDVREIDGDKTEDE